MSQSMAASKVGNTAVCTYIFDNSPLQSIATMTFYAVMLNMSAFVDPFFIVPWVTRSTVVTLSYWWLGKPFVLIYLLT